jgi:hypothetical protein
MSDLKQHFDPNKLNQTVVVDNSQKSNAMEEMDDEDMELYGDENSASEMDVDVAQSSIINEANTAEKLADLKDIYWIIIYGEEGWLRVYKIIIND